MTLANKWRPTRFEDVVQQDVICSVLDKEIQSKEYPNAMLFTGPAGTGKTTCAGIFASKINGEVIMVDGPTHSGVEAIQEILNIAQVKPLIKDYKCIVIDECHTLSDKAWSKLLIPLEKDIQHTVFIFCTTDIQKVPNTILSRVQRFDFKPMTEQNIIDRVKYICEQEKIDITNKGIEYIAKSANGNMRQALTNLDECLLVGLSEESICKALNIVSDDVMGELYDAYGVDTQKVISLIEAIYNGGYELHLFLKQFLGYSIKRDNIKLVDCILTSINETRYDDNPKDLIIARLIV